MVRRFSATDLKVFPGALESNAGDEFHLLWAVSRCLGMIRPDSHLQRVVIEGVSPVDQTGAPRRAFLAADVTEYYGGEHYDEATEVVVSQLKYSYRNPDMKWTAARLAPKGQAREKTILGKLADTFLEFKSQHRRSSVLDKLRIRLISNRPGHFKLLRLVEECQSLLALRPAPTLNLTVTQSLDETLRSEYQVLFERSGLTQRQFTDFIRVLDFDYLGSADRFEQERRISTTLGQHVLGDVASAARSLYELVRKQALPEASASLGIGRAKVLFHLGVTDESHLFPLPARVEAPQFLIRQPDPGRLAQMIVGEGTQQVVAHGDAGIGKSTSLLQLQNALPSGSVVVMYDCFAGGAYLSPTERRHLPHYAVRQLVNEIALKCGTPLVLPGYPDDLMLWRKLEQVLHAAGKSLEKDGSRLVLAIDAADNAVFASHQRPDELCFVPDLWKLDLPENVHVVMTCRSAQRSLLAAPDDTREMELFGFDKAASAEHLRHYFADATSVECETFHANSGGNPRIQSYVLDPNRSDRPMTPAGCVNEAAKTPEELFDDLLQTAIQSRLNASDSREWLAVLMAMDRPVRVESLAMVLDVEEEDVHRFCRGLVPGVTFDEDTVEFRDEDFEKHVRSWLTEPERTAAHRRIADCYLTLKDDHKWAAEAVAGHLFKAGQADRLIALTLDDRAPSAIADPLARNQAYLNRINLSLHVTSSAHGSDSLKLIALAATAKRTDSAMSALIKNDLDLAMRHADRVAVERVYEAESDNAWKGPFHMRVAASAARGDDLETARNQVKHTEAWLSRRSELDGRGRSRWRLEADDIASYAETLFYIGGPNAAANAVRNCSPKRFAIRVAERLAERLALGPSRMDLSRLLEEQHLPPEVEARLLGVLFRSGESVPASQLERVSRQLIERPPADLGERSESWPINLIEQAASIINDAHLLNLIEAFRPVTPDRVPEIGLGDWEIHLQYSCLEAVINDSEMEEGELLPGRLKQSDETDLDQRDTHRLREERKKLLTVLKENLPLYLLRASSAAGRLTADEVVDRSLRLLRPFVNPSSNYRNDLIPRFYRTAKGVIESLCLADADPAEPIDQLLATRLGDAAPIGAWLDAAELLFRRRTHISSGLHLVNRAVGEILITEGLLQEKVDLLVRCAALVDPINETLAGDYYSAAIEASSELREERALVLDLMNHLADSLPESDYSRGMAPRLRQAVEHFRPFMYDPGHLPWRETLATITHLNTDEGVRTLTLWDETGDLHLERGAAPVAKKLYRRGTVDVVEALQLLWLTDESMGCAEDALEILDRATEDGTSRLELRSAVAWLGERIARHLTLEARLADANTLAKWIVKNEFESAPWATDILAIQRTSQDLPSKSEQHFQDRFGEDGSAQSRHDRTTSLIALGSSDKPAELVSRLEQLAEERASSTQVGQYLSVFGASTSPDMRLQAMDAISQLQPYSRSWTSHSHAILKGLVEWISNWNTASSVRNWTNRHLRSFFLERFPAIVGYGYGGGTTLDDYLATETFTDPVELVLEATGRHIHSLSPEQLILIAQRLSDHLPKQDLLPDLKWLLDDLLGDTGKPTVLPSESGGKNLLPDLAWALLGHPDKLVRWRAAHFVLDQSKRPGTFVDGLMTNFDDRTGLGHYAQTSTFLWMSAQVWALLSFRRIAVDIPSAVTRLIPRLKEIATSTQWPHALLREIARRTLLELPSETSVPAATNHNAIAFANQPASCWINRRPSLHREQGREGDVRFRFNRMDTVPYWFAPLGGVFGVAVSQVETLAEGWVVDHLGYDQRTVQEDRPQLSSRYSHGSSYNDHGSHPRIENLRTYLEWHAMFLVAGELADSGTPTVVHDYEPPADPWSEWLTGSLNLTDGSWISDHRGAVPSCRYRHAINPGQETWRHVSNADFDREVLVGNTLVVSAFIENSHGSVYENVILDSALVCPESAEALLASLQDTPSSFSRPLPSEGDLHDREINQPGFQLIGWLANESHDHTHLEDHNPLRRITLRTIQPGRDFRKTLPHTHTAKEWRTIVHTRPGPVTLLRWSDQPINWPAHSRPRYTEGQQTLVRIRELMAFLSAVGKEIILTVNISRHFDSHIRRISDNEQEERYDSGTARTYILRRDGTLSDGMGRHFQTGTGDSLPTET